METDEQVEETSEEEITEEPTEESKPESVETEVEPTTAEDAMRLARDLQKGYTMTRQDMAAIKESQQKIQESLDASRETDEFGGDEEEPLTVKKFLDLQKQQQQTKEQEDVQRNQQIDSQLNDLRIQGIIKTKEDEEALLDFAVKKKVTNLFDAAERWDEIQQAKRQGVKEALKGKVKVEAGAKIGNSQKSGTKEQGVDYGEISSKSIDELAEG